MENENNKIIKKIEVLQETYDEKDEIPVNIPRWVLSSGTIIVLIMLIIGVGILWSIKFPETIVAPIQIVNQHPSVSVKARISGQNLSFSVSNKDYVKMGTPLAVIQNDINISSLIKLKIMLKKINENINDIDKLKSMDKKINNLGEIQNSYLSFLKTLDDYININNEYVVNRNINYFKKQIKLLKREVKQTRKNKRHKINLEISKLEKELFNYQVKIKNKKKSLAIELKSAYVTLENTIKEWDKVHIIKSPINGYVYLDNTERNQVKIGDKIIIVKPKKSMFIGKMFFNNYPSGKLKEGQDVKISLYAYPKGEYGILSGQLVHIPDKSTQNKLMLTVNLGQSLTTDLNYKIPNRDRLQGSASIILSDTRLLYRLFYQFRAIFK